MHELRGIPGEWHLYAVAGLIGWSGNAERARDACRRYLMPNAVGSRVVGRKDLVDRELPGVAAEFLDEQVEGRLLLS
jgi:hypothetical protein